MSAAEIIVLFRNHFPDDSGIILSTHFYSILRSVSGLEDKQIEVLLQAAGVCHTGDQICHEAKGHPAAIQKYQLILP